MVEYLYITVISGIAALVSSGKMYEIGILAVKGLSITLLIALIVIFLFIVGHHSVRDGNLPSL